MNEYFMMQPHPDMLYGVVVLHDAQMARRATLGLVQPECALAMIAQACKCQIEIEAALACGLPLPGA